MIVVPIYNPVEWVINRLWSLATNSISVQNQQHNISSRDIRLLGFNIPDFILLRDGIPCKWIRSDNNGCLVRKIIKVTNTRSNTLFVVELLQEIRRHFALLQTGYDPINSHSTKHLCRVFYKSGEQEKITIEKWLQVEANTSWWKNILALQSVVSEHELGIGVFHSPTFKKEGLPRNPLLDSIAKNLAQFFSTNTGESEIATVSHLILKFQMDINNQWWLLEVIEGGLLVRQPSSLSIEAKLEEEALTLSRRFRQKLFTLSQNEIEALFQAWDTDQDGFITSPELHRGLCNYFQAVISRLSSSFVMAIIELFENADADPLQISREVDTSNNNCSQIDAASSPEPIICEDVSWDKCRCLFEHDMNDILIEEVALVNLNYIYLSPQRNETACSDSIQRKVEAILDHRIYEKSLRFGENPTVVSDLNAFSNLNLDGNAFSTFILCENMVNLVNYKANTLGCGEHCVHRFITQNALTRKLASLDISIVYSGSLKSGKYSPGHVSASLSFSTHSFSESLSTDENLTDDINVEGAEVVSGIQTSQLEEKFGRICISFDPQPFIQSGYFQLAIRADSLTRYSVHISGRTCILAEDVMRHKLHEYFLIKEKIQEKSESSSNSWLDLRLMERRYLALVDMFNVAEDEKRMSEVVLEQNERLYLSTERDEPYHLLKTLNSDLYRHSRLVSLRKQQISEILLYFRKAFHERQMHSEEIESFRINSNNFSMLLTRSMRCMFGHLSSLNAQRIMNSSPFQGCEIRDPEDSHDAENMVDEDVLPESQTMEMVIRPSMSSIRNNLYESHEGLRETLAEWGFWQPRPLPLLKRIVCGNSSPINGVADERLRKLVLEQDRILSSSDHSIISHILHDTNQLFPRKKLLLDIELEITRIILHEILKKEREQLSQNIGDDDSNQSTCLDTSSTQSDDDDLQLMPMFNQTFENEHSAHPPLYNHMNNTQLRAKSNEEIDQCDKSFCPACRRNQCQWKSMLDEEYLDYERMKISKEIIRLKCNKTTPSTKSEMNRLQDLRTKASVVDTKVKLAQLDKELHDIYASFKSKGYFQVTSLHACGSLMTQAEAIVSLEREHDRLVAILLSHEIVDGILDWMLKGWCFGEYAEPISDDTDLPCSPYIYNRHRLLMDMTAEGKQAEQSRLIQVHSAENMQLLLRLEKNIKYFFLCLTFMYFRTVYVLQKEKLSWLRSDNQHGKYISTERAVMIKEDTCKKIRKEAFAHAINKIQIGARMRKCKTATEVMKKDHRISLMKQQTARAAYGSLTIQRVYRGHLGRKVFRKWQNAKARYDARNALCHACAIAISRVWRGFHARKVVAMLKRDLAQFILRLRRYDYEIVMNERD